MTHVIKHYKLQDLAQPGTVETFCHQIVPSYLSTIFRRQVSCTHCKAAIKSLNEKVAKEKPKPVQTPPPTVVDPTPLTIGRILARGYYYLSETHLQHHRYPHTIRIALPEFRGLTGGRTYVLKTMADLINYENRIL